MILADDNPFEGVTDFDAAGRVGSCEAVRGRLAEMFDVRSEDVSLMRLEAAALVPVAPLPTRQQGAGGNAFAAQVLRTKRGQLWNYFAHAAEWSLRDGIPTRQMDEQSAMEKVMAVPVVNAEEGRIVGVVQVCRQGATLEEAGADFTFTDLLRLKLATSELGPLLLLASAATSLPAEGLTAEKRD